MKMFCQYCKQPADKVRGSDVYPSRHDLHPLYFWRCIPCRAHVGCHKGKGWDQPLGRLANAELRAAKQAAHVAFDPVWKSGLMDRTAAYKWLAETLDITEAECHIGWMNLHQCKSVVEVSKCLMETLK